MANLANTSWLIVSFDSAGEVMFAGASTLTNEVFKCLSNMNRAYFRIRQQ
jgi:hypothetical protein